MRLTFRVGEEDNPVVTNKVMELDGTVGGISFEVWSNASETKTNCTKNIVSFSQFVAVCTSLCPEEDWAERTEQYAVRWPLYRLV